MKTLKFKLYQHKRNRFLKRSINAAGVIYNHCIALHKRYYKMWGKHLNCSKLQAHIAKLRKRKPFWQLVGSQAVQDICQRIEKAYQLFFKQHKKGVRAPGFKKVKRYKSFTLKQAGYKFWGSNRVRIGQNVYQYWNSEWRCPSCQSVNGRDENAARNIQRVAASTLKLGDVRPVFPAIAV